MEWCPLRTLGRRWRRTSKSPAATAVCGYATSVIANPKRSLFLALRSRQLPPAATPGRNQRGSRSQRTCPPEQPLQPRASRHPARAEVRCSAGPDLRAHVPSASQGPATGLQLDSVRRRRHSVSLRVRMLRYATGRPLPSTSGPGVLQQPQAPPVLLAHAVPVRSRTRVWHRGWHSRAKHGPVVHRRPCIARQAETVGPPQEPGHSPVVHAPFRNGCRASGHDGRSRAIAVHVGHRKVGNGLPRAAAA